MKFAAGMLDNIAGSGDADPVRLVRLLLACLDRPSARAVSDLYDALRDSSVMAELGQVISLMRAREVHSARLRLFSTWMARHAPDRDTIKFALAMISISGTREDLDLIHLFGRHDEFTKIAALAMASLLPEGEGWRA